MVVFSAIGLAFPVARVASISAGERSELVIVASRFLTIHTNLSTFGVIAALWTIT
jgi:hypothetical protein